MTRHVMLNNITHKDLRVITRYGAEFGDNVGTVLISRRSTPTCNASTRFFPQGPGDGEFQSIALLGFARTKTCFSKTAAGTQPIFQDRGPRAVPHRLPGTGDGGEMRKEP